MATLSTSLGPREAYDFSRRDFDSDLPESGSIRKTFTPSFHRVGSRRVCEPARRKNQLPFNL